MKTYSTIENILTEWGKGEHALPANNAILKSRILDKLTPALNNAPVNSRSWPWLSLALGGLAIITFVLSINPTRIKAPIETSKQSFQCDSSSGLICSESSSLGGLNRIIGLSPSSPSADYYSPPIETSNTPVTDNREFLKTNYTAAIKSRHVAELTSRLQTTVRGFGGRVDSSTSSEKSGYVSFVIPADKFEAFKNEAKDMAGARFFTETIQNQNLLPEKRSIEQQQEDMKANLAQLKVNRDAAMASHNNTVSSLQAQIDSVTSQLANLNRQPSTAENEAQKRALQNKIANLKSQLSQENTNFATNLSSLEAQIQSVETFIKNLDNQNADLLDKVATVNGTISISHIGVWQLTNLYLPAYWLPILLILAAFTTYFLRRRRMLLYQ